MLKQAKRSYVTMSDVETDIKREEEQRREEDERLDTAEDDRRGDDATEEVRRALLAPFSRVGITRCATISRHLPGPYH